MKMKMSAPKHESVNSDEEINEEKGKQNKLSSHYDQVK